MSYEHPIEIPPKVRAEILEWLGKAQARELELEKTTEWQSAMSIAMLAKDVGLLCELTRHWNWRKIQLSMCKKFEATVDGVK